MASNPPFPGLALVFSLFILIHVRPTLAYGAGNIAGISKVEGIHWRHGDIEDILLTLAIAKVAGGKKFDKLAVSQVYFGNWLRDYSQAVDVGTVKNVSAEAIRLLLSVLGFLTFGYGSKEFEVTTARLGCYRPEDHIDNPRDYAENEDARQYDKRLRGPIDERVELGIDEETGMKNYIANEKLNIMTSARHVRKLFSDCIERGRRYGADKNEADLHEALRLLGTGLHCLEDFFAHSNYTELALIELGEEDVFPHVGRDTKIRLRGANNDVYPLVTGTFGGVDFLHSVTGEVSDKLIQNEIEELEGTLQKSTSNDDSVLEGILDTIPDGVFGGGSGSQKDKMHEIKENAAHSQLENSTISPRDPEQFTLYVQQVFAQIMPAIEFHDNLVKTISEAIDRIPVLSKVVEQLEERLSIWVFTIIAPFVIPVIEQIKNELQTGSNEIIESSKREQHIVFEDDSWTDPTHSMLSKDHFTNILNEISGSTATKVVAWVVPQIMEAWDDDGADVNQLMDRIISGVLHHPAQRNEGRGGAEEGRRIMFQSIEEWWNGMDGGQKDEFRRQLSRDGVENGQNHKEGEYDSGHGCGKPLGMHNNFSKGGTFEDRIANAAANAIADGVTSGISGFVKAQTGVDIPTTEQSSRPTEEASQGGISGFLGSLLSGSGSGEGNESSTRRSNNDQSGGDGERPSQSHYSRGDNEYQETGSYGNSRDNQRNFSDEYNREQPQHYGGSRNEGYGGREDYQDRRNDNEYSSREEREYGGGRRRDDEYSSREEGEYGGGRRHNDEYSNRDEGQYGGGRRRDDEYSNRDEGQYGGGRRHDDGYSNREEGQYGESYRREDKYPRRDEGYSRRDEESENDNYRRRDNDEYGGRRYGGGGSEYNDRY